MMYHQIDSLKYFLGAPGTRVDICRGHVSTGTRIRGVLFCTVRGEEANTWSFRKTLPEYFRVFVEKNSRQGVLLLSGVRDESNEVDGVHKE